MSSILFLSATGRSNFELAKSLQKLVESTVDTEILDIEALSLPLYTPLVEAEIPDAAIELKKKLLDHDAVVITCPEYNGSITPALINAIAWVTRTGGSDWREAFNHKCFALATSSGGGGQKALTALRLQLDHIGALVMPRPIIVNSSKSFDEKNAKLIMESLVKQIS